MCVPGVVADVNLRLRAGCPQAASPVGWILCQLGLLLLPSSVLLASLLLFPALILGSLRREGAYWHDAWNWPLLVAGGLMPARLQSVAKVSSR